MLFKECVGAAVGQRGGSGVVVVAAGPCEGMVATRVAVQRNVWVGPEGGADSCLRILADVFVLFGQVVQQRLAYLACFGRVLLGTAAVVGHEDVGIGARWASPVGPIRLDLAYGLDHEPNGRFRLHFTLGPEL